MKKWFKQNKDVYKLLSGNAFAQLIPFVFAPVLSRMYTPSDFALLSLMLAASNILYEIYTLKYERCIVISGNRILSMNLLFFTFIISLGFSAFFLLTFHFSKFLFWMKDVHPDIFVLKTILPIITFFMSSVMLMNFWFQRENEYNKIVWNRIVQVSSVTLMSVVLGYMSIKDGLIQGYLLGWIFAFLFSIYQLVNAHFNHRFIRRSLIFTALKKYKDFPIYNLVPSVIYVTSLSLPYYYVSYHYGNENAGYFNMCKQMILVPMGFLGTAFAQVYLRKFAENILKKNNILPLLKDILWPLTIISLLIIISLNVFADDLFSWFLGKQWITTGKMTKIYCFSSAIQMIHIALSVIYPSMNLVKYESIIKFIYALSIFCLLIFPPGNIFDFLIYYSIIEIIVFTFAIIFVVYKSVLFDRRLNYENLV